MIAVPADLVARLEDDRDDGVDRAVEMIAALRSGGSFAGAHVVPVSRYRQLADRLA